MLLSTLTKCILLSTLKKCTPHVVPYCRHQTVMLPFSEANTAAIAQTQTPTAIDASGFWSLAQDAVRSQSSQGECRSSMADLLEPVLDKKDYELIEV